MATELCFKFVADLRDQSAGSHWTQSLSFQLDNHQALHASFHLVYDGTTPLLHLAGVHDELRTNL
jgi:hypothetical protein